MDNQNYNVKKVNEWVPCNKWNELPVGTWLVKVDRDSDKYHIAYSNLTITIVGGHFEFDMGNIVAYTGFEPYEE